MQTHEAARAQAWLIATGRDASTVKRVAFVTGAIRTLSRVAVPRSRYDHAYRRHCSHLPADRRDNCPAADETPPPEVAARPPGCRAERSTVHDRALGTPALSASRS